MQKNNCNSIVGFGIALLFLLSSLNPIIVTSAQYTISDTSEIDSVPNISEKEAIVTCSTYGIGNKDIEQKATMSHREAELFLDKIEAYSLQIMQDPQSPEAQDLQEEIIYLAIDYGLVPKETLSSIRKMQLPQQRLIPLVKSKPMSTANEFFCNYAAGGEGGATPVIIFPRLTPILLFPIPRIFYRWNARMGFSSCGGLRSGTGFMAEGQQTGRAIGFWGIGFSIFLPPVMAFGIIGYALYCSVEADHIEYWPPNYPPEINAVYPLDEAINIPITTSELSFHIDDYENELMSYSVTTSPDIGGDNANLKPDGTYTVPISGLEGTESYSWRVSVSDGPNTIEETYRFSTEPVAPIIENPTPEDGKRFVPVTLSHLRCHLRDLQGDQMDYTVETSPNIGSGSGTIVGNGFVDIPVHNLENMTEYRWYVNVTDGNHWKHKIFSFQTEPMMLFNPFDEGWLYRKNITIDHIKVAGDLINFPILISTIDVDLRNKAQADGADILFMDGIGVANRLYHEIEKYDTSTGELITWVNTSFLDASQDTSIYVYYGNANSSPQQYPEQTWDEHYVGIWHLNEKSGVIFDTTIHHNDGVNNGATYQTIGKIGYALDFEEEDPDNVIIPHSTSLDITSEITVECWVKPESFQHERMTLCTKRQCYYTNVLETRQLTVYTYWNNNGQRGKSNYMASNTLLEIGYWTHCAWTETTSGYRTIFIDGINDNEEAHEASIWSDPSEELDFGYNVEANRRLDGVLDEVRISNIARSSEWITTGYTNQNNPNGFCSIGPEEIRS